MPTPSPNAASASEFVISRVFDAPRDLVWKLWTEEKHLKHWWGPKGFTIVSVRADLRPGGAMHYGMRSPDGTETWGRFVYREIVAPERLVFIVSFSDSAGGVTRHPWSATWPMQTLSTVMFEDQGGKTIVTVKWLPYRATELERKTFNDGMQSMQQGWTGTFEQFGDYLAKVASEQRK
jgi:uncharacterized protein YndB with AHSA1/START domain